MTTPATARASKMFDEHGPLAATILDAEKTASRVFNRATRSLQVSADFPSFTGGPDAWYGTEAAEKMIRSAYGPGCENDPGSNANASVDGAYIAVAHPAVVRQLAATTTAAARFVAGEIDLEALAASLRDVTRAAEQADGDIHWTTHVQRPEAGDL